MLIVFVDVHVKPESIQAFREATIENARESVKEPGVARFDVLQQEADPARFMLVEVYRAEDAPAAHKETPHYAKWRDTVAPLLAEPRRGIRFTNIYPGDDGW